MSLDRFIGWLAGALALVALPLVAALYSRGMLISALVIAFLCGMQTMSSLLAFARDGDAKRLASRDR